MGTENPAFRLAFRVEGDKWVAYVAKPNTMKDAIWLGALHMTVAAQPDYKEAFMELMKGAMAVAIESIDGARVKKWTTRKAPEHERAGRG